MREPTYPVMASLLDGPLHGYAIIQRAGELSGGRVRLSTGTLYAAPDRLTAEGHVELVREEIVNGRVRQPATWLRGRVGRCMDCRRRSAQAGPSSGKSARGQLGRTGGLRRMAGTRGDDDQTPADASQIFRYIHTF
jgi:hypothetical protein